MYYETKKDEDDALRTIRERVKEMRRSAKAEWAKEEQARKQEKDRQREKLRYQERVRLQRQLCKHYETLRRSGVTPKEYKEKQYRDWVREERCIELAQQRAKEHKTALQLRWSQGLFKAADIDYLGRQEGEGGSSWLEQEYLHLPCSTTLRHWVIEGYGPQPDREGNYKLAEMEDFLLKSDISKLHPLRVKWLQDYRLNYLETLLDEVVDTIRRIEHWMKHGHLPQYLRDCDSRDRDKVEMLNRHRIYNLHACLICCNLRLSKQQ